MNVGETGPELKIGTAKRKLHLHCIDILTGDVFYEDCVIEIAHIIYVLKFLVHVSTSRSFQIVWISAYELFYAQESSVSILPINRLSAT